MSPATNVVLSGHRRRDELLEAVEAGACGYLAKTEVAVHEVAEVVRAATAGEVLVDPGLLAQLVCRTSCSPARRRGSRGSAWPAHCPRAAVPRPPRRGPTHRTHRLDAVGEPRTVGTHVQHLLPKLGVRSRLEAVVLRAPALLAASEEISRLT